MHFSCDCLRFFWQCLIHFKSVYKKEFLTWPLMIMHNQTSLKIFRALLMGCGRVCTCHHFFFCFMFLCFSLDRAEKTQFSFLKTQIPQKMTTNQTLAFDFFSQWTIVTKTKTELPALMCLEKWVTPQCPVYHSSKTV